MSTFAVYLHQPDAGAWEAIRQNWPNRHFILDERVAFVAPEGIVLTSDVAKTVGVATDADSRLGIVLEISAYFGFDRNDLWEWLSKVRA